ncbi:hypothetical protein [Promicromonospora sukumoe]
MTEQELNELVAELAVLEHDATPAPWSPSFLGSITAADDTVVRGGWLLAAGVGGVQDDADGALIVKARNALPALLGALQAVRREAAELKIAVEMTRAYVDHPGNWSALDGRRQTILEMLGSDR